MLMSNPEPGSIKSLIPKELNKKTSSVPLWAPTICLIFKQSMFGAPTIFIIALVCKCLPLISIDVLEVFTKRLQTTSRGVKISVEFSKKNKSMLSCYIHWTMAVGERVNALYKESKSFVTCGFCRMSRGKRPCGDARLKMKSHSTPLFLSREGTPACLQFVGERGEQIVFQRRVETLWDWF